MVKDMKLHAESQVKVSGWAFYDYKEMIARVNSYAFISIVNFDRANFFLFGG